MIVSPFRLLNFRIFILLRFKQFVFTLSIILGGRLRAADLSNAA